jgi:hypothetical protein
VTSCAHGCGQVYAEVYSFPAVLEACEHHLILIASVYINYSRTNTELRQNHWNGMAVLTLSGQQPACSHSESGAMHL